MTNELFSVNTLDELEVVAKTLASRFAYGQCIALSGQLGAGKTTFVQVISRALGVTEPVTSPTFTLVNEYESSCGRIIHIDFYRIKHSDELYELGLEDYFTPRTIVFVEWAELFPKALPNVTYNILLTELEGKRILNLSHA